MIIPLAIIGGAAVVGYYLAGGFGKSTEEPQHRLDELTARLGQAPSNVQPIAGADSVQNWILERLDRHVRLPVLGSYQPSGITIAHPSTQIGVPLVIYSDSTNADAQVAILIYNYRILDNLPADLGFSKDTMTQLEAENEPFSRQVLGSKLLFWRDRDDIFVAVLAEETPSFPEPTSQ